MSIEASFAEDDSNNNVLGQNGDGNDASQSDGKSQSANQNSMCVSAEITTLSCTNIASEDNGFLDVRASINGKIYTIQGPSVTPISRGEATSSATCNDGDSILSGYFSVSENPNGIDLMNLIENVDPQNNEYSVYVQGGFQHDEYFLKGNAVCFDNH